MLILFDGYGHYDCYEKSQIMKIPIKVYAGYKPFFEFAQSLKKNMLLTIVL